MLRDTLKLIASEEVASSEELARRLKIEPALARRILDDLVSLGYLRFSNTACTSGCTKCPARSGCGGLPEMMAITQKGRQAASRT